MKWQGTYHVLIVIGKWGKAYACKVQTPKDHPRKQNRRKPHWGFIQWQSALYWLMLKLPPHNPQTRKLMPVRDFSLIVSTFIHISGKATPERGRKARKEDPCQLSSQGISRLPDKVPWKTHPARLLGASPPERKQKPRELMSSILWCYLVSVWLSIIKDDGLKDHIIKLKREVIIYYIISL